MLLFISKLQRQKRLTCGGFKWNNIYSESSSRHNRHSTAEYIKTAKYILVFLCSSPKIPWGIKICWKLKKSEKRATMFLCSCVTLPKYLGVLRMLKNWKVRGKSNHVSVFLCSSPKIHRGEWVEMHKKRKVRDLTYHIPVFLCSSPKIPWGI